MNQRLKDFPAVSLNKTDRPDMKVTCHPRLGGASRTGGGGHRNTGLSVLF